jgi:alpha/beta superfamily hydrolase
MKNNAFVILLVILAWPNFLCAQKRYRDLIFTSIDQQNDISYAADTTNIKTRSIYKFDLYTPKNDTVRNRPLVIWIHGGGFVFGSKQDNNIRLWCETFARRGYVCASINYRLGKLSSLFNFNKLVKNGYPAVLDARQAVRYFRAHQKELGIDTSHIILAGNSAGAMVALQTVFSNNRELADSLRIKNPGAFGGLGDGPVPVMSVINFWGGIYNISWLKNSSAAVVNVFGSTDRIISPGFSKGTYGGQAIYDKSKALHRSSAIKVFKGYGHELYRHFNPLPLHPDKAGIKQRWLQAGQFAADFLSEQMDNRK